MSSHIIDQPLVAPCFYRVGFEMPGFDTWTYGANILVHAATSTTLQISEIGGGNQATSPLHRIQGPVIQTNCPNVLRLSFDWTAVWGDETGPFWGTTLVPDGVIGVDSGDFVITNDSGCSDQWFVADINGDDYVDQSFIRGVSAPGDPCMSGSIIADYTISVPFTSIAIYLQLDTDGSTAASLILSNMQIEGVL